MILPVLLALLALAGAPAMASELPEPLTEADFPAFDPRKAQIGRLLFYDKILSGNRNISCGTCHHHDHAGGDGVSLGIGEGGVGVGPERTAGEGEGRIRKRIPRNSPALWNLGAKEVEILFHDGRLSISDLYGNGFNSPAAEWLPQGLDSILAAQALFPLTSRFEMAGDPGENEVAGAIQHRIDAAWPIIAKRVRIIPQYAELFVAAFDTVDRPQDVTIVEIANALAAFMGSEWRSFDSPFDRFLAGDTHALGPQARAGMELFYGPAGCSACHGGKLLTDHSFHALGLPAFGPGRSRLYDPYARDVGRMGETDDVADAYRFRTPSLRNVALTAPYGHNGAYETLRAMLEHHGDPAAARARWRPEMAKLPRAPWLEATDFVVHSDAREMARQTSKLDIVPSELEESDLDALEAFLAALTGGGAKAPPLGRPDSVPSGLPVD